MAVTIRDVQETTARLYGLTRADLIGPRRTHGVRLPRHVAMYLSRKLCQASYPDIGRAFGNRDHSTVMHACKRAVSARRADADTATAMDMIEADLLHSKANCTTFALRAAGGGA